MRLSKSLCAVIGEVISTTGSHQTLDFLFKSAGAPGEPPELSHASKWKEWLFRAGQDPNLDSLSILGTVIEEFMDVPPPSHKDLELFSWHENRERIESALQENGLRYFRFGRVLPQGEIPISASHEGKALSRDFSKPEKIDDLLEILVKGLRRAMHPLTHRRKGCTNLVFSSEYDVQDLLHAMLRPWVNDIRPEEFTPSYAGSSTRMDFLLPQHLLVLEIKFIRDAAHAKKVGQELIIDIAHYRKHSSCQRLWCIVYDPNHLIGNSHSLKDLEGTHESSGKKISVKVIVV